MKRFTKEERRQAMTDEDFGQNDVPTSGRIKSNTMHVNGNKEEWSDRKMRDWYEDHCTALTQELCNRNATLRKLSKEYKDLQQAHADLQQAYTNEMLRNGELAEELKKVNDETI